MTDPELRDEFFRTSWHGRRPPAEAQFKVTRERDFTRVEATFTAFGRYQRLAERVSHLVGIRSADASPYRHPVDVEADVVFAVQRLARVSIEAAEGTAFVGSAPSRHAARPFIART